MIFDSWGNPNLNLRLYRELLQTQLNNEMGTGIAQNWLLFNTGYHKIFKFKEFIYSHLNVGFWMY